MHFPVTRTNHITTSGKMHVKVKLRIFFSFFFETTKMSREKTIKSIFTVSHTFGLFTYKSKTLLRWVKEEGNGCQII